MEPSSSARWTAIRNGSSSASFKTKIVRFLNSSKANPRKRAFIWECAIRKEKEANITLRSTRLTSTKIIKRTIHTRPWTHHPVSMMFKNNRTSKIRKNSKHRFKTVTPPQNQELQPQPSVHLLLKKLPRSACSSLNWTVSSPVVALQTWMMPARWPPAKPRILSVQRVSTSLARRTWLR